MNRFSKKMAAMVLTAAMALTIVSSAFAATSSPVKPVVPPTKTGESTTGKPDGKKDSPTDITGTVNSNGGITMTNAASTSDELDVNSYMINSKNESFDVDVVATGSISGKKYTKVLIGTKASTTFQKKVVAGKAKKSKKIIITTRTYETGKLKASNFHKQAFKGFKGKIIVRKRAMSKKEFKKLVKKLRKGGFKGKIVRRG